MKGQAEAGEMDMATGEAPRTLDEARDPEWLASALTPVSGGATIRSVEVLEAIRTMATKVRFAVDFDGADGPPPSLLPQGFSGCRCGVGRGRRDHGAGSGFLPADRALISVRTPTCVSTIVDRDAPQGIVIMRDLIGDGARFCTALEAFTPDQAAQSLEQIARLNVQRSLLDRFPWIGRRVDRLAEAKYVSQATPLQDMLDGSRGEGLPTRTRDAGIVVQHQCPGINIARAEIEVGFNALLDAFPNMRLDPDAPAPYLTGGLEQRGISALPVLLR